MRYSWCSLVALLLVAPLVNAQDRRGAHPAHRSLDNDTDPTHVEDLLTERLRQAGEKGELQKTLQNLLKDRDRLRELTKGALNEDQLRLLEQHSGKIGDLLNNPQFRQFLEQTIAQQKANGALSAAQIETLKNLAQNKLDPKMTPPPNVDPQAQPPGGGPAQGAPEGEPGGPPANEMQPPVAEPAPAADEKKESWWDRQWKDFSNSVMEDLNDPSNAAAFQDALRGFGGLKQGADGGEQFDFNGLWNGAAKDVAGWLPGKAGLESVAGLFKDLKVSMPNIGGALGQGVSGAAAGAGSGGGSSDFNTLTPLFWAVGGIALAVVAYNLTRQMQSKGANKSEAEDDPWPIAPATIATAADLRRAFEHLARLRLGEAALTANHLEVAFRLRAELASTATDAAATELAQLYERARYVPAPAHLDEADFAAARRDLTLLAGMPA